MELQARATGVSCSPNLCVPSFGATDATKLQVSPRDPRVPRSHTLELRCESECDPQLKPSLRLTWSKGGAAFETNGTEDGRWASGAAGAGVKGQHWICNRTTSGSKLPVTA